MIKIFKYVLLILSVILILSVFVYWIANPEYTQMQIFLKFWYNWVSFFVCGIVFSILDYSETKTKKKLNGK